MTQSTYRFEVSEYEEHGRISVGSFGEFPDTMKPSDAVLLLSWWKSVARKAASGIMLWTAVRSFRLRLIPTRPPGVPDATIVSMWTQKNLLAAIEHQVRAVSWEFLSEESLLQAWAADGFGLFEVNSPESLDARELEALVSNVVPTRLFLRGVRLAIIPWYHRQWLDLYCPLLEVQHYVADLRDSAAELGLKLEQGQGEFV